MHSSPPCGQEVGDKLISSIFLHSLPPFLQNYGKSPHPPPKQTGGIHTAAVFINIKNPISPSFSPLPHIFHNFQQFSPIIIIIIIIIITTVCTVSPLANGSCCILVQHGAQEPLQVNHPAAALWNLIAFMRHCDQSNSFQVVLVLDSSAFYLLGSTPLQKRKVPAQTFKI